MLAIEQEIKRIRIRNGWTQHYLANLIGVKQATISRIETNAKGTTWNILYRLFTVLNFSITPEQSEPSPKISLQENPTDLFIKILLKNPKIKTCIFYNPSLTANYIIQDFQHANKIMKLKY